MTDPIADYVTRLRKAIQANHRVVEVPASNLKKEINKTLFASSHPDIAKRTSVSGLITVSYTHLDVYKRQGVKKASW